MPKLPSPLSNEVRLREAVERTSSVKECLEFLGLRAAGGNYKQLRLYCAKFGITPKRGDTQIWKCHKTPKPLAECLTANSKTTRASLKRRLVAEGLVENKCHKCKRPPEWEGASLSLQLEHINGVHNDNRLENLCLLCPNCHSQTETFAGRATRTKSYGVMYGPPKLTPYKFAIIWPNVEELHQRVNASSINKVAKELGVSWPALKNRLLKY